MKDLKFSLDKVDQIPSSIGVYIFRDEKGKALYIGKSVNLKARILSHIRAASLSEKEASIFKSSKFIEIFLVPSEYLALILEAKLIREERPKFNKIWMDDKSYLYIKITNEEFPKVYPVRERETKDALYFFGPFSSLKVINSLLRSARKIFPFCSQKKIGKKPCFYSKLGLCDPCPAEVKKIKDKKLYEKKKKEYLQNIKGLVKLLQGDVDYLKKHFYKQLERLKKEEKFEEAIKVREQIKRLEALSRLSFEEKDIFEIEKLWEKLGKFLKEKVGLEKLERIECYDISNLKGKEATGSMVVMENGALEKSEYRKFKIKLTEEKGDLEMLSEVIKRRFQNPWKRPDLILLDGGVPQVRKIKQLLKEIGIKIPVIGLAKKPDRIVILKDSKVEYIKDFSRKKFLNFLRYLRDESHRFAKKYHLLLRRKKLVS